MTAPHPKSCHSSKKGPLSRPLSRSFLEGSVLQEVGHMALVFRTVVAAFAAPFAPGTTVAPAFAVTTRTAVAPADRKSVVQGKSVSVSVDLAGSSINQTKTNYHFAHIFHTQSRTLIQLSDKYFILPISI